MHLQDTRTILIYGLADPSTRDIRYIGQTTNLRRRLYSHMSEARGTRSTAAVYVWLRALTASGHHPLIATLDTCDESDAGAREREVIAAYRAAGSPLLNSKVGSDYRAHPRAILVRCFCPGCGVAFHHQPWRVKVYCSERCWRAHQHDPRRIATRFWKHVDKRPGGCWLWTGGTKSFGYGAFGISTHNVTRHVTAHRMAWILQNGAIPEGLCVLHNCPAGDNPACVNPGHLWLGTHKDNVHDMVAKGRQVTQFRDQRGERHPLRRNPQLAARGERNAAARLTAQQVVEIRQRYAAGADTYVGLGREYGVDHKTIWFAVNGQTWAHLKD